MKIDSSFAEFVGILIGDGSLNYYTKKNNYQKRLKITFHSEQKAYQLYVQNLVEEVLGVRGKLIKRKGEKTVDLLVFNKKVIETLIDIGLVISPKWDRAKIPEQIMTREFAPHILRGYFDTDGSVVITNNNGTMYPRLEMKISPSPMQNQLKLLLDYLGFHYGCYDIGKGKVRIQMNGKRMLLKWKKDIGFSNKYYADKEHKYWQNSKRSF